MSLTSILKDTSVWVWILLVFLIMRGIKALSDREIRVERLFLLPLVFLVWGVYGVLYQTYFSDLSLMMMGLGLIIGIAFGWALWKSQPRLKEKEGSPLIIRPGTPLTLVLIVITFMSKFILSAMLSIYPVLLHSLNYNLLFGLVTGILDGVFWGATLNLFITWYKRRNRKM
ncbi:hypothetical protein HZS38_03170 [Xenorhabdus nematophila]|uniref:Membrane protein n=1 Tax=Xenorhabdus nematophila (strain ATCC 19061 / DSM 3370 / CCUG 14189 / LMG 1036 / NCIMB 9965 / AN6) TaxID=406817 RepID=D3VAK9_XENNA|nr:DUF6622 family protein [Xenorhabdus nematophila]CEE91703.1 putative membrane protein [Xenorhabdus nematophila str. Anatoliense]CEF32235.1 putative membrane protein [Xenorhabdus nematophila str. Websteri]AYA39660.1 hypothetical protein D3790_03545 [Xenorhabdus nematophila]KHD29727.1 membrane protein [Xenorhabdus nematophila]MBA0018229.1 hypothetical protein [Xenorhabdus nematophila]